MYFESFEAFLQMGKHGPYVWGAYGISLLLIVSNIVLALRAQRQIKEQIRRLVRRQQAEQ